MASGFGGEEGQTQQLLVRATFSSFLVRATSNPRPFKNIYFKCPILEDKNIF